MESFKLDLNGFCVPPNNYPLEFWMWEDKIIKYDWHVVSSDTHAFVYCRLATRFFRRNGSGAKRLNDVG